MRIREVQYNVMRERPSWNVERAESEWNAIVNTPGVDIAYEGPAGSRMQVACPAWVVVGCKKSFQETSRSEA